MLHCTSSMRLALAAAALALMTAAAPASAQTSKAATPHAKPTKAELDNASRNFKIMLAAMQSDKIPDDVKGRLFICMYQVGFGEISTATDKLLESRKLDTTKPGEVIGAMAAVCGYQPKESAKTPPSGGR